MVVGAREVEDQHAADADPRHRLQAGGETLAGDVAVHPGPINVQPGRGGRVVKAGLEVAHANGGSVRGLPHSRRFGGEVRGRGTLGSFMRLRGRVRALGSGCSSASRNKQRGNEQCEQRVHRLV